jgi:hypothetical protein
MPTIARIQAVTTTPTLAVAILPVVEQGAAGLAAASAPAAATGGNNLPLWGAAALALAAGATAYALTRRREREAEHEAELERKREQAAEWAAKATALKAQVEANKQTAHSAAAVVVAAAAVVADVARRSADQRVERLEERLHAQEVQAQERARLEAARQAEEAARAAALAQAERLRAIAEARDQTAEAHEERTSQGDGPSNTIVPPLRVIDEYRDEAAMAIRGVRVGDLLSAARDVDIEQVGTTMRVTGSRASRDVLGFREMVNWFRPENVQVLPQGILRRSVGGLMSWGVAFGLGLGLASDTLEFVEGNYDGHEYAAALSIDTGVTIASALFGGLISGAATGAAVGLIGGTVTVPLIGSVAGAVVGGLIGGVAGLVTAVVTSVAIERSGVRDLLIGRVAELYRSWTG